MHAGTKRVHRRRRPVDLNIDAILDGAVLPGMHIFWLVPNSVLPAIKDEG